MAAPVPAMPLSTANWHWKNKNVTPWAKTWFERELGAVAVTGAGGEALLVEKVTSVQGDAELGQRKSKLITIYDCRIELDWSGTAADGTEAKGTLVASEVSHEVPDGLSDYVYEWTLTTASSKEVNALYQLAKKQLPGALEKIFNSFPAAMIDTHGRDIQIGTPSASGASTPAPAPAPSASASSGTSTPATKPAPVKAKAVNTSEVKKSATFMTTSDELFSLLTDAARIPTWTRAPAVSEAKPDTEFALFGGGVKGKYVSLTPGKEIVQTWALQSPSWPTGHFATLTTTLEQSDDSTKVTFKLSGVPKGMEDEISHNLEGYYIHGFKSIGYVPFFPTSVRSASRSPSPRRSRRGSKKETALASEQQASNTQKVVAIAFAMLALVAAFTLPYFYK
jgi:activator of HSP90 ATPase